MGLRVGGLASGLDTAALVESLLALERRPLDQVEQRKSLLELEQSIFRDLNTKLLALRDAAAALDNLNSGLTGPTLNEEFLAYSASSSDESILTATASASAVPGTFDIRVDQLAASARHVTTSVADQTALLAVDGDTLSIDFGGAAPIDITVGAAGASLLDLKDLINLDPNNGGELRADVVFDGTGYRMIVAGTQTGAANDLDVTTSITNGPQPLFDATLRQSASDARLTAFGVPMTRASNSVTDVVPGVALELLGTGAQTVQVQVSLDESTIADRLTSFADAYNAVIDMVTDQLEVDAEDELAGPLSGDSTLRGVQRQIQRALVNQYIFTGNPFESLADIGLSMDEDLHLSLDTTELSDVLAQDPIAVREILSGDGTNDGIASAVARLIDPLTDPDPAAGILAARNDGFDAQIRGLDLQIDRLMLRLEKREELLVQQFTLLETTLASLQGQGDSLLALITQNQN